jgi:hypothetical protein
MANDLVADLDRILGLAGDGPRDLEKLRSAAEALDDRQYRLDQGEIAVALARRVGAVLCTR